MMLFSIYFLVFCCYITVQFYYIMIACYMYLTYCVGVYGSEDYIAML